jgi:membrane-associated phospholipid phosphatase
MYDVLPVKWTAYYSSLNPNPVAANPSLHAALPFVGFLALLRLRSPLAWPLLAWCVAVWFSVIYLGEHYVLDVVAGVVLATLCSKGATLLRPLGHQLATAVPAHDRHHEVEAVRV